MPNQSNEDKTYTRQLSHKINVAFEAYKAGEPGAKEALHRAFREQATNILRFRFYPDYPDPSLEYEIAERALLNLDKFRGKSKLSTWFHRIAQNEATDALSALIKRRDGPDPISHLMPDKPSNQDDKLDLAKLREGLPPEQDEVLDLVAAGYSLGKIAKKLDKPLGTIRSRYRLAKEKMKRKTKNEGRR